MHRLNLKQHCLYYLLIFLATFCSGVMFALQFFSLFHINLKWSPKVETIMQLNKKYIQLTEQMYFIILICIEWLKGVFCFVFCKDELIRCWKWLKIADKVIQVHIPFLTRTYWLFSLTLLVLIDEIIGNQCWVIMTNVQWPHSSLHLMPLVPLGCM